MEPEKAGYLSAKGFLSNKKTDSSLNFSCKLKPNEVVSGIIEGNFAKGDEVLYKFGESSELIETLDLVQSDFSFDIPLVLEKNKKSSYRLGDGLPYTVRGQYGSDIIINIKPKETGWMKLSFSPRGGTGALVFENKGKVFCTNFEKPKSHVDSSVIYVIKDKTERLRFIPFGGLNYPIVLYFEYIYDYNPKLAWTKIPHSRECGIFLCQGIIYYTITGGKIFEQLQFATWARIILWTIKSVF